jgi:hypothetical protein
MNTTIIACKTIEDELNLALEQTGLAYPIEWLESGLHSVPKDLNAKLRDVLSGIRADRVLVAMGFCGNSIQDIKAGDFELIIPRVDDCISLLLGGVKKRIEISRQYDAYFLTDGWLRGERNVWVEYQLTLEKYGEKRAALLAKSLFGHYRSLCLLDSGAMPIDELIDKTTDIAETLNLKQEVVPASIEYIKLLLTGPWSEEMFIVRQPGEAVTAKDLIL